MHGERGAGSCSKQRNYQKDNMPCIIHINPSSAEPVYQAGDRMGLNLSTENDVPTGVPPYTRT